MNKESLTKELQFKAIRSSGAGGQHVNKVSTKIELTFNLDNSLDKLATFSLDKTFFLLFIYFFRTNNIRS